MASIQLNGVSVEFRLYDPAMRSVRRQVLEGLSIGGIFSSGERQNKPSIIALNDISLELEAGDRVALIGHNGAGKTTLLRVMAGIYEPTRGRAKVDGRISPIFDVQLGMDKEATGYENIALRGLLLGMTRPEIEASTEDIASFSELGPFLDMPLHTYSTGMALRLAFAISTSIEPEILLLDEWIGAGDKRFIEKAQDRLQKLIGQSNILVVATHQLRLVRKLCNKAVLLERGSIKEFGPAEEILEAYEN
jgi:ABC-type polysaccharide/polyol phosphate transport system ATPase subunit